MQELKSNIVKYTASNNMVNRRNKGIKDKPNFP